MKKRLLSIALFILILPPVLNGRSEKNILLITIDTLRADRVSVYSDTHVTTPNIDRLARKSAVFKRAFAHTPVTLPSHASILTGTTPLYHGISGNNRFRLDEKFLTLAEHLKKSGYKSAALTASFVLNRQFGLDQGFDRYNGPEKRVEWKAEKIVTSAIRWITGTKGPWFLWVHLWDPHYPYDPPEPYKTKFSKDLYSGEAAYTDAQLGVLFGYLDRTGLSENTIIVFTSDHGESLGAHFELEHGYFAYNETIHVPLIIFDPGFRHATIHHTVSHIDIFPTVCDLVGTATPAHVQGRSLKPIMKGEERMETPVYFEAKMAYYSRGWPPLTGFIDKDMKFIHLPIPELYDLKKDYGEHRNIASSADIPGAGRKLDRLIKQLTGPLRGLAGKKPDSGSSKKLRSLGYLTGEITERRSTFSREDDPKIQFPLSRAEHLENDGNFEEALKLLFALKRSHPEYIGTSVRIADIYLETGQIRTALKFTGEEIRKNPGNTDLLLKRGILLVSDGHYEPGARTLGRVIRNLEKSTGTGSTGPRAKGDPREWVRNCIITLKHTFYNKLKPRVRAQLQTLLTRLDS